MPKSILDKAHIDTKSFHEKTVLYEILLQQNPTHELEIELNEIWARATNEELLEWANAESEKYRMPTFHPDEYLEYSHPVDQGEFFVQASEKKHLARKNLGME